MVKIQHEERVSRHFRTQAHTLGLLPQQKVRYGLYSTEEMLFSVVPFQNNNEFHAVIRQIPIKKVYTPFYKIKT
jgi:hypothetical protein